MPTLPQLIEEDIRQLDQDLKELLASSEGSIALIIDKGGFLINHQGDARRFDLTTIAASRTRPTERPLNGGAGARPCCPTRWSQR